MRTRRILLAAVIALSDVATHARSETKPQATPSVGTLQVSQKGRGPLYIEGSITFFRVYQNGKFVEEKKLGGTRVNRSGLTEPGATTDGDMNSFSLPPGEYELRGYVRDCDGNCASLSAPKDECAAVFRLSAGETIRAVRNQTRNGRCTIEISSNRK